MLDDLFAGRTRFHNVFHYQAVTWAIRWRSPTWSTRRRSSQAVFKDCSYGAYNTVYHRRRGGLPRARRRAAMTFAEGTPFQHAMSRTPSSRWRWPAVQLFGSSTPRRTAHWHIKSAAQRGPAGQVRPEVRDLVGLVRVRNPSGRTATTNRPLGDRRHRLGSAQGDVQEPRSRLAAPAGDGRRFVARHRIGARPRSTRWPCAAPRDTTSTSCARWSRPCPIHGVGIGDLGIVDSKNSPSTGTATSRSCSCRPSGLSRLVSSPASGRGGAGDPVGRYHRRPVGQEPAWSSVRISRSSPRLHGRRVGHRGSRHRRTDDLSRLRTRDARAGVRLRPESLPAHRPLHRLPQSDRGRAAMSERSERGPSGPAEGEERGT